MFTKNQKAFLLLLYTTTPLLFAKDATKPISDKKTSETKIEKKENEKTGKKNKPININKEQLELLAASKMASKTAQDIAAFTQDDIKALTDAELRAFGRGQIAAITIPQLKFFTPQQFAIFRMRQLKAFTPEQIAAITPDQKSAMKPKKAEILTIKPVIAPPPPPPPTAVQVDPKIMMQIFLNQQKQEAEAAEKKTKVAEIAKELVANANKIQSQINQKKADENAEKKAKELRDKAAADAKKLDDDAKKKVADDAAKKK